MVVTLNNTIEAPRTWANQDFGASIFRRKDRTNAIVRSAKLSEQSICKSGVIFLVQLVPVNILGVVLFSFLLNKYPLPVTLDLLAALKLAPADAF